MSDTKQAEYHRARREKAREEGRCLWCSRTAVKGYALCRKHRAEQRQRFARLRADGLCPHCGSSDYDGESWGCSTCQQLDTERKAALVECGLCRTCGKPNDSECQTCDDCRARYNAARQARRAKDPLYGRAENER